MYQIVDKERLAPKIVRFKIKATEVAENAKPGQFLIVRVNEKSERIPLTIVDYESNQGLVTIIVQEVGFSSREICNLEEGQSFLDVAGPLGNGIATKGYKKVACVGGGLGNAALYPKAKALATKQTEVISILGAKNAEELILEEDFAGISDELYLATDDGSKGQEGFVTDVLDDLLAEENFDLVIAVGPMVMMKAVADLTEEYDIKTIVSLNSLMIDGTGMCGGCRVTVGDETKFACVDGPAFDAHLVDFEEQLRRQDFYAEQEEKAIKHNHAGGECQCHQAQ